MIYFLSVRIPEVEIFFSSTGGTEIILIIHLSPYFHNGNDGMMEWWNIGMMDLKDWGIAELGKWGNGVMGSG